MKINLSEEEIIKLEKIFDRNIEYNENIFDFVYYFDQIRGENCNLIELFKNEYETNDVPNFIKFNINEFKNNPYILNIKAKEFNGSKYSLKYKKLKSNTPFLIDDVKVEKYREIIDLGYFNKSSYEYISISKDDYIWMEITPHEIRTMQKAIDNAHGNVLIYGLGLGYFTYMVSLKDNVNDIYIVEQDPQIINIFKTHILPFFSNQSKIHIIQGDAIKYNPSDDINYCFIDLWHDATDGLDLYLKLIKNEKENIQYDYWIEDSLIELIRRYFMLIIFNDYDNSNIFKYLNNLSKDIKIDSLDDLNKFLSNESIKSLIK